jgi:hypothetical protein
MAMTAAGGATGRLEAERPGWTRFEMGEAGGVIVPVRVNGRGPLRFVLDTGSTHSAIGERAAEAVAAVPVARASVASVAGEAMLAVVRLDSLEVGPVTATGLMPSVIDDAALDRVDGILGQDVLAPLTYTIDYRRRAIAWTVPPPQDGRRRTTLMLEPRHGRYLVRLPQRTGVLWLVPDSGAATLLLFDDPKRPRPAVQSVRAGQELRTLTSRRAVRTATVGELRVGGIPLRDVPVVLMERPASSVAEAVAHDGLLPLHLFDRVTFDGPYRMLVLER